MLPKLTVHVRISCTAASVEMIVVVGWGSCCQMWQASSFFLLYLIGCCSHRGRTVLIFSFYLLYDIYHLIYNHCWYTTTYWASWQISIASELYLELSGSHLGRDTSCPDMFQWFTYVPPVKCQNSTLGHYHVLSEPFHHESLFPLWMLCSKCK
jgi:hypothetical protein